MNMNKAVADSEEERRVKKQLLDSEELILMR